MNTSTNPLDNFLYDKTYHCPVCFETFTSKTLRVNKNQALSSDIDLYTHYAGVNPLLYEIIVCPKCAYAASYKVFDTLLPTQAQWIKAQITAHCHKRELNPYRSLEEGIFTHQLALICALTKKAKMGEQGYLALHIAWLYRDLGDCVHEKRYLLRAVEAFEHALIHETFPLMGIDTYTIAYMIAALYYQLGQYDKAKPYVSDVILKSQGALKSRAIDLKALLFEPIKS